jgi:hypothetical protein
LLKIQKEKRAAEVIYRDRSRQAGSFFVSLTSSHRHGPESIADLLNGERRYLPFEMEDGPVVIVQKNAILMVCLQEREVAEIPQRSDRVLAEVTFLSGHQVTGIIYNDLPSSYPRLSDCLNGARRFFHLEIESTDCLINSDSVKHVLSTSEI